MDKGCKTCALDGILAYRNTCKNCVESGTFSGWTARTCENCTNRFLMGLESGPCKACFAGKVYSEWKGRLTDAELEQTAEQQAESKLDPIHPAHYTECSLECIDVMLAVFGRRAVTDFCILNAFKYMWRYEHKNGLEDLQKAERYLAMATTFQTGDTEHEIRIINMQEELEVLMRRVSE